ncbi:DUF4488 domain-containing protein [Paludibacter sp. 221]|uniref:DUF4488 domain-containing protein n=1 Tax=Paludibacter sp. 221 TaxID=2302939 RepID=UPI0013D23B31|nr:DUF4488 domain-containing protein [Paludibacter sp. 221]NDV46728.1 DUF4488 domain-containing protein [Paludibacter sp. 221]
MKRIVFFVCFAALFLAGCNDKTKKVPVVSDFVGIWQLCGTSYDGMPTIAPYENARMPQYKIISDNGRFSNMILSRNTYITVYGTYKVASLSEYVECVEKSYTNPLHDNYKNVMQCELINGKYLKLSYPTKTDYEGLIINEKVDELWVKVPYGNPFEVSKNNVADSIK